MRPIVSRGGACIEERGMWARLWAKPCWLHRCPGSADGWTPTGAVHSCGSVGYCPMNLCNPEPGLGCLCLCGSPPAPRGRPRGGTEETKPRVLLSAVRGHTPTLQEQQAQGQLHWAATRALQEGLPGACCRRPPRCQSRRTARPWGLGQGSTNQGCSMCTVLVGT